MRVVPSICTFCGVGCGIGLRLDDGQVLGVEPQPGHPVSQGQLCAKGWSTSFAIDGQNRLNKPLIKERGCFRRATWDEALARVASEFSHALNDLGPQGVGVISCARATIKRQASARLNTPAMQAALISPTLWPATQSGLMPHCIQVFASAYSSANNAGWV